MKRYAARWVTARERERDGEHNGVVEDVTNPKTPEFVCEASPMNLAKRIAAALNITERFSTGELHRMAEVLVP